jgi:hypothetical protein
MAVSQAAQDLNPTALKDQSSFAGDSADSGTGSPMSDVQSRRSQHKERLKNVAVVVFIYLVVRKLSTTLSVC